MDTTQSNRDVFLYLSDSRQVPNWIALDTDLSLDARNLAHRIIIGPNGLAQPGLEYYASVIGVTPRTAYRWLDAICKAGYCTIERVGRRTLYRFFNEAQTTDSMRISSRVPTTDSMRITDPHGISDPHAVSNQKNSVSNRQGNTTRQNNDYPQNTITDPVHGGGGGHHDLNSSSTNTNQSRAAQKFLRPENEPYTDTEMHMISHWRFSRRKAFALRLLNLDDCKADYAIRRASGGLEGSIIEAWEAAPPPPAASSTKPNPLQSGVLDFAALRAQYGDLYGPADDAAALLDRADPDIDQFLGECGL